jgi:hypothetical protein
VASNSQLQWIVFRLLAQTSFKERLIKHSAAGMFGKQAALLNSAIPMEDPLNGARGVAGVAIGMLGSAIGKGDGDALYLLKREERRF